MCIYSQVEKELVTLVGVNDAFIDTILPKLDDNGTNKWLEVAGMLE